MGKKQKHSAIFSLQIDPRKSKRIGYWDGLTSAALIYTAFVTPAEVALLECATSLFEPLFMINRIVDTIFFVDMLVQFFLMVEKQAPASSSKGTIWLSSPGAIAKNYLTSWFLLDLTSILVSVFDFMCFDFVSELLGGGSGDLTKLKILRVLRVLRLVKLVRLARRGC